MFCIFSGDLIINNLAFYELMPQFECQFPGQPDVWKTCTQEDFCPSFGKEQSQLATSHRIDWKDEMSLHNWVTRLDMQCSDGTEFATLGSYVFFGWTLSSLVVTRLSDLYGRKWVLLIN